MRTGRMIGGLWLLVGSLASCRDAAAPGGANLVGSYVLTEVNGKGPPFVLTDAYGGFVYALADTIRVEADRSAHRSEAYGRGGASYGGFYYIDGDRLVIRWNIPINGPFSYGYQTYDTLTIEPRLLRRVGQRFTSMGSVTGEWTYTAR